ncbi:MAG TPA: hypothetical protein VFS19_01835 [Planctomycetota bacterium]|nr:hypothetical protein [Planctomycetota bacterium]
MSKDWTRRELLKWASLAGAFPLLNSCAGPPGILANSKSAADSILGKSYLKRGIEALSDSSLCGPLSGHGGAAVITAYYFCRENALDERTVRRVRAKIDEFMLGAGEAFDVKRDHEGPPASPDRIAETLAESVSSLRAGGHDAIFASLALKALRELPELATEPVVDGLCRMLRNFAAAFPIQTSPYDLDHPLDPYRITLDIVRATSLAILRQPPGMRMSSVLHWVTHADALVTLSELGYDEVAKLGHKAHQQAINHPGAISKSLGEDWSTGPRWFKSGYWESTEPRGGFWGAGHAFKFPYSILKLANRLQGPDEKTNGLERVSWLLQSRG